MRGFRELVWEGRQWDEGKTRVGLVVELVLGGWLRCGWADGSWNEPATLGDRRLVLRGLLALESCGEISAKSTLAQVVYFH